MVIRNVLLIRTSKEEGEPDKAAAIKPRKLNFLQDNQENWSNNDTDTNNNNENTTTTALILHALWWHMQITVSNVHLRLEDELSDVQESLATGVAIESLVIHLADEVTGTVG